MFDGRWRDTVDRGTGPVGRGLQQLGISADVLTATGLVSAAATAVAVATGHFYLAIVLLILTGLHDLLDGPVAKASGTSSVRGAFFDSVTDRVSDALILGGIAWYLVSTHPGHLVLLPFAILGVTSLVSYQRAKAESLGISAKGGLMERAERMILLGHRLHLDVVPRSGAVGDAGPDLDHRRRAGSPRCGGWPRRRRRPPPAPGRRTRTGVRATHGGPRGQPAAPRRPRHPAGGRGAGVSCRAVRAGPGGPARPARVSANAPAAAMADPASSPAGAEDRWTRGRWSSGRTPHSAVPSPHYPSRWRSGWATWWGTSSSGCGTSTGSWSRPTSVASSEREADDDQRPRPVGPTLVPGLRPLLGGGGTPARHVARRGRAAHVRRRAAPSPRRGGGRQRHDPGPPPHR